MLVPERRKWLEITGLILVLLIGLLVRLEDLRDWRAQPERAFFQGEPILTTHDGYFYLSLARDLLQGAYHPIDQQRAVPDNISRPSVPPLLSVLAAGMAMCCSASLNWTAVLIPAFLGILLAVPLFFWGRQFGGSVMGVTASLFALLSPYYLYKSSFGWFDTDSLNVTFAVSVSYCFFRFGVVNSWKRYLFFCGGLTLYLLFLWWWHMTPETVTAISLVPLVIAIVFYYRPTPREGILFFSFFVIVLVAMLTWKGLDTPLGLVNSVVSKFGYISKMSDGVFPSMGITSSQLESVSFADIAILTVNNLAVFSLSLVGLIWLLIDKPKQSLFLVVLLILAGLSIFYGRRFLIFMAPISGLGLGYFISRIWFYRRRWQKCAIAAPAFLIICLYPSSFHAMAKTYWPLVHPLIVSGMNLAAKETPADAVIWTWWDYGYALRYWSERGTISDGAIHSGQVAVYNAIPLATDDFRLAANFMQFYVSRGLKGMDQLDMAVNGDRALSQNLVREVLTAGPEKSKTLLTAASLKPQGEWQQVDDWLRFFFPPNPRPIYLFMEQGLTFTGYWWYWIGTWDIDKQSGVHPYYEPHVNVEMNNIRAWNAKGLNIDLVNGTTRIGEKTVPIRDVFIRLEGARKKKQSFHANGLNFEVFLPGKFAVLEDPKIAESVFNKLFLRHFSLKSGYFKPVKLLTPIYQLWVVHGDQLTEASGQGEGSFE